MLQLRLIFFELKIKRSFSLGNFLSKSTQSSLSSHSHTWRKSDKFQFPIPWVHISKFFALWTLHSNFGLFPNIKHTSHKAINVEGNDVHVVVLQLNSGLNLFWRFFSLEDKISSWFGKFWCLSNFWFFYLNIRRMRWVWRIRFHHHDWVFRSLKWFVFRDKLVVKLRLYLHSIH